MKYQKYLFHLIFSISYSYFISSFYRSHSSQQRHSSSSPYLNSGRQRSTSESEQSSSQHGGQPQPPPRTKNSSKAKLKKASTELQAVKLNRSMSESNVIASLRYGRSDDENDMEVSHRCCGFFFREGLGRGGQKDPLEC